jgi:predicted nucleic acid-binding Zn ribbon protein
LSTERVGRHKSGTGRPKSPREIAGALQDLLREIGIEKPMNQYAALTNWDDVVGEQIAKVTRPDRVDNGILIIKVATAPWRAELTLQRTEILRKVAARIGKGVIKDIRFR